MFSAYNYRVPAEFMYMPDPMSEDEIMAMSTKRISGDDVSIEEIEKLSELLNKLHL